MRVTTLIENDRSPDHPELRPEFGLSLLVEHAGRKILFDTGQTGAFADNADALGIDLGTVDLVVLSHHHFDHGGGLETFFGLNDCAPVFLRPAVGNRRIAKAFGIIKRSIGIDATLFERFRNRFHFITDETEILSGVHLLTAIGSEFPRPPGNRRLFVERDGELVPDDFEHELVMVMVDDEGLVVISGCSHSGILNMVDAALKRFPGMPLKAVFGGFHLAAPPRRNAMACSPAEVVEIGRQMLARGPQRVFTGHCTGPKAFAVLAGVMEEVLQPIGTGFVIEV